MNLKKKLLMMSLAASMVVPSNLALVASVATPVFAQEFNELEVMEDSEVVEQPETSVELNTTTSNDNWIYLEDNTTYTVSQNTTLDKSLFVSSGYNVTIKLLNNATLSLNTSTRAGGFIDGNLTIEGQGTITYIGSAQENCILWVRKSGSLILGKSEADSITLNTTIPTMRGIGIQNDDNNNGKTLSLKNAKISTPASGIYIDGLIITTDSSQQPSINLSDTTITSTNGHGIYQAGMSNITIGGSSQIKGVTGIETRAGTLTVNSGKITGGNKTTTVQSNPQGTTTENAGIAVAPHTTHLNIDVQINDGEIEGAIPVVITDPENKINSVNEFSVVVDQLVTLIPLKSGSEKYEVVYSSDLLSNESISKIKDGYFKCGRATLQSDHTLNIEDDSIEDLFDGKLGKPTKGENGALTYSLVGNVSLDKTIVIPSEKKISINLDGHTLSSTAGWAFQVFDGASLDIKGTSSESDTLDGKNLIQTFGAVSLNIEDTTLNFTGWGLNFWASNDKANAIINVKNSIFQGGSAGISPNGQIPIDSHPIITLESVKMYCNDMGIYQAGPSDITVKDDSYILGTNECGIEVRAGSLTVENSTVEGGKGSLGISENGSGSTTTNAGIAVAQHNTARNINVKVTGSTISATAALTIANPQQNEVNPKNVNVVIEKSILNGTTYDVAYTERSLNFLNELKFDNNVFVKNEIQKLNASLNTVDKSDGEYRLTKKNGSEGTLVLEGTGPYNLNATPAITEIKVGDLALSGYPSLYSDPHYNGNTTSGAATVILTPTQDNLTFGSALSATYEVKDNSTLVTPPSSGDEDDNNQTPPITTPEEPVKKIALASFSLNNGPYILDNGKCEPGITVYAVGSETPLMKGKDYTVSYQNSTSIGEATIIVRGTGDYEGELTKTYIILDADNGVVNITFTDTASGAEISFDVPEEYLPTDEEGNIQEITNGTLAEALTNQSADSTASESIYAPKYEYTVEGFEDSSQLTAPTISITVNRDSIIRLVLNLVDKIVSHEVSMEISEMSEIIESSEISLLSDKQLTVLEDSETEKQVVIYASLNQLDTDKDNIVTKDEVEAYISAKPQYSNAQVEDFTDQDFNEALQLGKDITLSKDGFIEIVANAESTTTNTKPSGGSGNSSGSSSSGSNTGGSSTGGSNTDKPVVATPVTMYRLYNRLTGEHLYTLDKNERDHLLTSDTWQDEGEGWIAPSISDFPVYRLLNPNTTDHHYTMDENEYKTLQTLGWEGENIAFFSADPKSGENIILYRLYNPNEKGAGSHHYTTDENEKNTLVKLGWQYEGTAWAGLPANK